MSVQVRRRRETAAFLSSFVGAQGELLVDTTNNRVQVHDGTTPGGSPAAAIGDLSGRNAIINGTFAINQRSNASGTALTAGAYGHDRWKAGAGGCTYTFTQTVPDTTITITAGTLIQAVDAPNVAATSFWLTWKGTATARVWQGSASGSYSAGSSIGVGGITVNALLVSGLTAGTIANIEFGTGTFGLVQFEAALPNAGPTRFERRHGELAFCQRYFQRLGGASFRKFALGYVLSSTQAFYLLAGQKVEMRAAPTMSSSGNFVVTGAGNFTSAVSSINLDQADTQQISFSAVSSGLPTGGCVALMAGNDPTARIDLSAEL